MPSPRAAWIQFMIDVWKRRDLILEQPASVDEMVKRIYNMYNYSQVRSLKSWGLLLSNAEAAWRGRVGGTQFKFQGTRYQPTGREIADNIAEICRIARQDNLSLAALYQSQRDAKDFNRGLARDYNAKLRGYQKRYKKGEFSKNSFYRKMTRFAQSQPKEMDLPDERGTLGAFIWYYRPGASSVGRPFRLYATPLMHQSVPVYADMVRWLSGVDRVEGLDARIGPQKGKVAMPRPQSDRIDRIVMYCKGDEQLKEGVEWFRHYQERLGKANLFEAMTPRTTKPVEGLRGIGVSQQPHPNPDILTGAGVKNEKLSGMSFGMSRAALLFLALQDATAEFQFRANAMRLIREAGMDIDQTELPDL